MITKTKQEIMEYFTQLGVTEKNLEHEDVKEQCRAHREKKEDEDTKGFCFWAVVVLLSYIVNFFVIRYDTKPWLLSKRDMRDEGDINIVCFIDWLISPFTLFCKAVWYILRILWWLVEKGAEGMFG